MRRVAIAVLVLLVAAVAAAGWAWQRRTAPRFIVGAAAVGPGEAALLTRINTPRDTRTFVELVAGDAPRWSVEVSPLVPTQALEVVGAAADAGRIVVLGVRDGADVAIGLDRASGAPLWQTTLPGAALPGVRLGPSVLFDGPRVILVRGEESRIDAVAAADGALLWSHLPRGDVALHLLAPDHLLVASRARDSAVLGGEGQVLRAPGRLATLCATSLGVLADGEDAEGRDRVVLVGPKESREVLFTPHRVRLDGPCGVRGGDLVFGIHDRDDEHTAVVRVGLAEPTRSWEQYYGSSTRTFGPFVASGELPRFVPVATHGEGDGRSYDEVAVLDLDVGDNYHQHPDLDGRASVVIAGGAAVVWLPHRGLLAQIGQTYGKPISVTVLPGLRAAATRPEHVRDGSLWLYGGEYARPAALPWARFDLAGGVVVASGDVAFGDGTDKDWALFRR